MRMSITNARVFDGRSDVLTEPTTVTVDGQFIASLGDPRGDGETIDAVGHTLIPGLIDAHWHSVLAGVSQLEIATSDPRYIMLRAAQQAERTLLRGFTTIRDTGGPSLPLKLAIDQGVTPGPRIYPSGAMITQTSGHGDFRVRSELPRDPSKPLSAFEQVGISAIADGVDEVLRAARQQLMLGATQLKVMAGGGIVSPYDPLDATQYTEPEIRAAVDAAANWGTYVTVHAYTPASIRQAVRAGVRCVEHGQLLDDETVKILADRGIWWCLQPFLEDDANPMLDPASRAKQKKTYAGTERAYEMATAHGVKVAFGSDILFDPKFSEQQGAQLAKLVRWYAPAQVLRMATHDNASLLAMCGERNPYPAPLGVVEPGAYADLLLVRGDPLADIDLIADPTNLAVIIKDGQIVKNEIK
ncbi:metal-dependent hydrolase family protein [Salinispora arenicola]|uniref:metal-dependent hydrolase family protein n=1 Tax=Salinispora arenicola TaxID=168697 RepID=UPI0027DB8BDA|nr:amidohydrolase family protein [Salinispora arenicola]